MVSPGLIVYRSERPHPTPSRCGRDFRQNELGAVTLNPETLFDQLIDFAWILPDYWDELRRPVAGGKFYNWDQFPEVTLLRLEIEARVHYRAGLVVLRNRPLVFAADVHVRNLIEFMAHVAWIHGASNERPDSSQRDRALCLELGIGKAAARATAEAQPESVPEQNPKLIQERVAKYEYLHAATGSPCKGRDRRRVRSTIEALIANHVVHARLLDLWAMTSEGSHLHMPDRYLADQGSGVSAIAHASQRESR
jgi:hypothetical protein